MALVPAASTPPGNLLDNASSQVLPDLLNQESGGGAQPPVFSFALQVALIFPREGELGLGYPGGAWREVLCPQP